MPQCAGSQATVTWDGKVAHKQLELHGEGGVGDDSKRKLAVGEEVEASVFVWVRADALARHLSRPKSSPRFLVPWSMAADDSRSQKGGMLS